jgi:CDP-diacylglycerol--serine O-phosphatidyltransferase
MQSISGKLKYVIPTAFTLGNILCGCYAVFASIKGAESLSNPNQAAALFTRAALAIGLAIVMDNIDGRIARTLGATSDFGTELDSLADVLTFGGAAVLLAYLWALRALAHPWQAVLVCFVFVACGAARLVRSNLGARKQVEGSHQTQAAQFFVGLPIPAAAAVIGALVYFSSFRNPVVISAILLLLAALMVSPFRYSKLKIPHHNRKSARALVNLLVFPLLAVLTAISAWFSLRWIILIAVIAYAAHGAIFGILRPGSSKSEKKLVMPTTPDSSEVHG